MKVYLIQHAQAKPANEDPERAITEAGEAAIRKTALLFKQQNQEISEIRHSTKLRARQTATIVADTLDAQNLLKETEGLLPEDSVATLASELAGRTESLVIVGHMPFLGKLASHLLCGDEEHDPISFYNAGIVCLEKNADRFQAEWIIQPWMTNGVV